VCLVHARGVPYNHSPVKLTALLAPAIAAAFLAGAASTAQAQPKGAKPPAKLPKACGVTALPLAMGNEWTYEPIPPPPERALTDAQMRLTPIAPKKLVIKVTGIETQDGVTTVSLTEDHDGRVHTTSIKCNAAGMFQIANDAFWFSGEPGKVYGIELEEVERKGVTLSLLAGKLTGLEWRDDMKAKWKRVHTAKAKPQIRKGTMELSRHWVVLPEEEIEIKQGDWAGQMVKTAKLGLETLIKVTIEPAPPLELKAPPLLVNFFWMVDGTGPIQIANSYGQQYLLTHFVSN
jgi:hypothetical protein